MQVGGYPQKDIMSEWKRAFLISQTSRAKLFSAMPWRENVCWKRR